MTPPPSPQPTTAPETQFSGAVSIPGPVDYHGYRIHADGWIEQRRFPGRPVLPYVVKGGYLRVTLALDCERRGKLVHVLVAEAFLGPKPDGHQVNHIDGDKTRNGVDNLEYLTPAENVRHALDILGVQRARGSRVGTAKLVEATVAAMRADYAAGSTVLEIATAYDLTYSHAWRIVTGRSWGHVA